MAECFGCSFAFSRVELLIVVAEIKLHECWIITGYWAPPKFAEDAAITPPIRAAARRAGRILRGKRPEAKAAKAADARGSADQPLR